MAGTHRWKICLVGDTGVGKTCVALRFYQDRFTGTVPTIGYAFMEKELAVDDVPHVFNLWDTAGQERYRSLARGFFRRASAMVLVYDITNLQSFEVLGKYWIRSTQRGAPENVALAIVGNKCDVEDERQVSTEEAEEFAKTHDAVFMEVSAKSGANIHSLFEKIARRLLETPELEFKAVGMRILTPDPADDQDEETGKDYKTRCCSHLHLGSN
ncbi:ras-related protein Rab-31-like [Asterias rubens]|uniref:ras-related protein Rab-31-like n=1 Tax=Asterias rubens TaxID=7604 RepID=UPI00145590B2|nr:ras-related protein Rab-31-like [Asterias rubens]